MDIKKLEAAYLDAYDKWANKPRPVEPKDGEYPPNYVPLRAQHQFREREWYVYVIARDAYWKAVNEDNINLN